MPKESTPAMALAWMRFKAMSETEQMAMFVELYRRSTVLSIDRANAIAGSQVSVTVIAVEPPVA